MPKDFWKRTNDAARKAGHDANKASEATLKKDWRLKQTSRGGSQSRVTLDEIRKLGRTALPQV
ncbi:MAG TPA: hypothetical protein VNP98_07780 [Chthoniobacterales bacterium]|nr:hypothetical protein [Chthoniobacterales bacterium]